MLYRVIQTKLLQEPVLAQCAPVPGPESTVDAPASQDADLEAHEGKFAGNSQHKKT